MAIGLLKWADSFVTWNPTENKFVFNIDQTVEPGDYNLSIHLSDQSKQRVHDIAVNVFENSPPQFASELTSQTYKQNSGVHIY